MAMTETLTGSEKQVAWALKIRDEKIGARAKQTAVRVAWSTYYQGKVSPEEFKSVCAESLAVLESVRDAAFWIDLRERGAGEMIAMVAGNVSKMRQGQRGSSLDMEQAIRESGVLGKTV